MMQKELESSHLSSFSVNLTYIFKIIAKYRQKSLFIAKWEPTINFYNISDFLKFDQMFLFFKFSSVVRFLHEN